MQTLWNAVKASLCSMFFCSHEPVEKAELANYIKKRKTMIFSLIFSYLRCTNMYDHSRSFPRYYFKRLILSHTITFTFDFGSVPLVLQFMDLWECQL